MATKLKEPPFPEQENFINTRGQVSPTWLAWFRDAFNRVNERASVTGDGDEDHVVIFDSSGDLVDSNLSKPGSSFVGASDTQALTNKSYEGIAGTNIVDKSANEDIAGTWRIPKLPSSTYTTEVYLTESDFGRVIKINSSDDVTVVLPDTGDVDQWLTVIRLGSGAVRIQAVSDMTIAHSNTNGYVLCQDTRTACNLTLYLASATQYAIVEGFGIWWLSKAGGVRVEDEKSRFERTLTGNLIPFGGVIYDSDKYVQLTLTAGISFSASLEKTWREAVRHPNGSVSFVSSLTRKKSINRNAAGSIDFEGAGLGEENVLFGGEDATWGGEDITW